jgi:alpha-N-arabinofuranosidase
MDRRLAYLLFAAAAVLATRTANGQAPQAAPVATKAPSRLEGSVNLRAKQAPISPNLYGMFIEHGGNLINHGLWAEMLDDRKFFNPIDSSPDAPLPTDAQDAARAFRMRSRRWRPVGGDRFVVMDNVSAYTGTQSPEVLTDEIEAHGFAQTGLALEKDKAYVGHIVIRKTPGVRVQATLSWGDGSGQKQTVELGRVQAAYASIPIQFTSQDDTEHGTFSITGLGSGSFHVGAVSLMPVDNLEGFRKDTIARLRDLHSGMWRLPGGNYISAYEWRDAVGDRDHRAPNWDPVWGAVQPNDVGMDELMTLCRLIGVEPYITVNAGFGDATSASDQVEYMNGSVATPMGSLRAKNGHPEPYGVKLWNVGNEPYGWWQLGHMSIQYYPFKHNLFAAAMRKVDPSITVIASGAMLDEMTVLGNAAYTAGVTMAIPGTETDWTGGMLASSMGNFDGISEHWYARMGTRFDITIAPYARNGISTPPHRWGYVPVEETQVEWIRHPSNRVREKAEEWDDYKIRFPEIAKNNLFLSMDEWAYTGGPSNLKLALAYAEVLQEMFRHTSDMKMSAFTMGLSTLDYNNTRAEYNANGLMFKLYRDHLANIPVELDGNSPQPAPKWPIGGEQPKVNAGSPTYPLDVIATTTEDGKFLTLGVVNPTNSTQSLVPLVRGGTLSTDGTVWTLTGQTVTAANSVGKPEEVTVTERVVNAKEDISVAPISINVYRFAIKP